MVRQQVRRVRRVGVVVLGPIHLHILSSWFRTLVESEKVRTMKRQIFEIVSKSKIRIQEPGKLGVRLATTTFHTDSLAGLLRLRKRFGMKIFAECLSFESVSFAFVFSHGKSLRTCFRTQVILLRTIASRSLSRIVKRTRSRLPSLEEIHARNEFSLLTTNLCF